MTNWKMPVAVTTALLAFVLCGATLARAEPRGLSASGFVAVNGRQLYYEVRGPRYPSGTVDDLAPVVLVHGLTLDHRMWDRQFDRLAKQFVTYRFDLPGHGLSDAVSGPVALHDEVVAFMDAMHIERAHLVGQSLGGNAVTEVAATQPQRVAKLVLIDSGINGFAYPTPNVLQRIPGYLEIFKARGRAAALQAWVRDPLFAASFERPLVRRRLERIVLSCTCSLYFNPSFQIRPPTFERLTQIASSTLLLVGELDTGDFQAATDALHQRIPDARKVVIEGAGHMANMDRPAAVTRQIVRFLNGAAPEE